LNNEWKVNDVFNLFIVREIKIFNNYLKMLSGVLIHYNEWLTAALIAEKLIQT